MRKLLVVALLAGALALVTFVPRGTTAPALPAADKPLTPTPKPAEKPADWQADPVCHMVFFAVLEGL
jgi:hypothetical protein